MATETVQYPLPEKYLHMPVALDRRTGNNVTLARAIEDSSGLLTFDELKPDQRQDLVIAALNERDDFVVYAMAPGASDGRIDRARAVEEVLLGSPIGQKIVRVEGRLMMELLRRFAVHNAS